jgi:hypothetical protein
LTQFPSEDNGWGGSKIKIGLTRDNGILRIPECHFGSDGYKYVPGKSFININNLQPYGIRDTIGCGYDWKNKHIVFTLNGVSVGTVSDVSTKLYPFLSIPKETVRITTNSGERSFMYLPTNGGGVLTDEDEAE